MKHNTGLLVMVGGAALVGFILLSHLGKKGGTGTGSKGPAYGAPIYGPGHENVQITVRNWQGHPPHRAPA